MPQSMLTTAKGRQPTPKGAKTTIPKGLAPTTKGQAGPLPKKPRTLRTRGVPKKSASAMKLPSLAGNVVPGATDITPPSPIGGTPGALPSFTAPPRPMNMPNMGLGHDSNKRNPKGKGSVPTAKKKR